MPLYIQYLLMTLSFGSCIHSLLEIMPHFIMSCCTLTNHKFHVNDFAEYVSCVDYMILFC